MALTTPTTQQLSDEIVAQLEASYEQTFPLLPKAFSRVLAKVLAAAVIIVYRYGGFSFLQQFSAFATWDETEINGQRVRPLVEIGRRIGVEDPQLATRAELVITVVVQQQTGTLPGGSQLVRAETGVIYLTTAPVALNASTVPVSIQAESDQDGGDGSGSIGNLEVGDIVSFANPLPNVATDATVASVTTLGVDAETQEQYRARVQNRERAKPQGGALADYRAWGEAVEGVAAIYPYVGQIPGEVDVFVETDAALDPDGIPDGALLADVADAIELAAIDGRATNRPVGAAVNVIQIVRSGITVTVANLEAEDPGAAQSALSDGLDSWLRSREPFIVGLSVLPRLDRITQGAVAGVVNEILSAEGATASAVSIALGSTTVSAHTLTTGEKVKLSTVVYE